VTLPALGWLREYDRGAGLFQLDTRGDAHPAAMAEAHQTVDAVLNKWRTAAAATS
jgi:hypothetical protein